MADKILGPQGSKRRKRFLWVPMLLIACTALFVIGNAQAVHDTGRFQLDGDASTGLNTALTPVATDDWDKVCNEATGGDARCHESANSSSANTTGATSAGWTADCYAATLNTSNFCGTTEQKDASTFTGGGSKDPQEISSWLWKNGSSQPKDELEHAFAARYALPGETSTGLGAVNGVGCPNGTDLNGGTYDATVKCQVIFYGSDRFSNNGDATQAFWFLQSRITLNGAAGGGGTHFTGSHSKGDLLAVSDFSIGGATSTITVYSWDPACTKAGVVVGGFTCGDANLKQLVTESDAKCTSALPNDAACGLVNPNNGTEVPWTSNFTDKDGNHTYAQGELFEAGLNLSLLGVGGECFNSVVAETRASTSTTSTLSDFVITQFKQCKPNLTTNASSNGTVAPGTAVHDTATITVSGGTNAPDPTGTVTFFLCGPSSTGNPDCSTTGSGTNIGTGTLGDADENPTTPNDGKSHADSPNVNTSASHLSPGYYCFRAEWPGDTNYPGALSFTDTSECFRVQDTSSMNTAQDWIPNDTATVTSANATALNGSVVFTLYDGAITCATPGSATVLYGPETKTLSAAASPAQVSTSNSGANVVKITSGTSRVVTWKVVFTSSDSGVASPASPTCETTTLTISN